MCSVWVRLFPFVPLTVLLVRRRLLLISGGGGLWLGVARPWSAWMHCAGTDGHVRRTYIYSESDYSRQDAKSGQSVAQGGRRLMICGGCDLAALWLSIERHRSAGRSRDLGFQGSEMTEWEPDKRAQPKSESGQLRSPREHGRLWLVFHPPPPNPLSASCSLFSLATTILSPNSLRALPSPSTTDLFIHTPRRSQLVPNYSGIEHRPRPPSFLK